MSEWRAYGGKVHEVPAADGWRTIFAVAPSGRLVGIYSAPFDEWDEEIAEMLAERVKPPLEARHLKIID